MQHRGTCIVPLQPLDEDFRDKGVLSTPQTSATLALAVKFLAYPFQVVDGSLQFL